MELLTRLPLQRRIMVLVTAGLGLTVLLVSAVGLEVISQSTKRVLEERRVMAQVSATNLDERLGVSLQRLEEVGSTFRLDSVRILAPEVLRALTLSQARPGLFSGGFLMVDRERNIVWPQALSGTTFDEPALRRALGGVPSISGLVRLPASGDPVAVMWVPLRTPSGATAAVLGGVIDLQSEALVELVRPLALGRTGHAVIVDAEGVVLAGTEEHERFTRGDHPDFFGTLIRLHQTEVARTPEIVDGVPEEIHVMAFAPLGVGNWGLGFGQAEWEVFLHERRLGRRLFILSLLLVGAGLLVAWWDAGVIAKPLRRLTASAGRIAEGDLQSAIAPESGYEVRMLAETLETMRGSLARTQLDLQARTAAMERQADQTRALYDVSRAILSDAHLSDVLGTIASSARSLLGAEVSSVCLWDGQRRQVIPGAFDGPKEAFHSADGPASCEDVALGRGRRPAITCPFIRPEFRRVHVTGDVRAGDRLIGFMCVGGSQARRFREDDAHLLSALAGLAALAIESAQLREQVQHLAVLEERERISRDLHDSIIQSLYGISLGLEHVQHLIPFRSEQATARLDTSIQAVTGVIQGIRSYVMGLHPQNGRESLSEALEGVVREFRVNSLLPVEFHPPLTLPPVGPEERLHLQLLIREALANALRHAQATRVVVKAGASDGIVSIEVADDGQGFDPAVASGGLGLRTMAERARRLGGTVTVQSRRGSGTTIQVSVPVRQGRRGGDDTAH